MAIDEESNKGPTAIVVCSAIQALATLFAAARIFCRIRKLDWLYLDDWIILISLVCGWIAVALTVLSVQAGDGQHMDALTVEQQSQVLLWTIAGFFPVILSFTLPKLAVICLLSHMLNPSRRHLIFMWSVGGMMMANAFVCLGMLFGRCKPFRAVWDLSYPDSEKTCFSFWHIVGMATWTSVLALVADFYLALYPSLVLRKLQINLKKKIALSCALGVGSVSVLVAGYKCTRLSSMASADFSYDTADLTIWTIVEGSVVNIAACIPLLKPLVDIVFGTGALDGSSYEKKSSGYRQGGAGDYHSRANSHNIELGSRSNTDRPRKDYNTTAIIKSIMGDDDNDSQESILSPEGKSTPGSAGGRGIDATIAGGRSNTPEKDQAEDSRGIMRTHEVTVTYGADDGEIDSGSRQQTRRSEWV